ncbi:guanylate kinase [Micromonospora sp. WMMD987]|uniref:guanylate kinase n=1 Tax=Micromonospora sp. WMMD987 TaxID=3016089 RepID=UPI00249BA310|nr:guanylate kinase [Micromonospora sp. WMMD987]WFE93643.1 guanylate kinase [Micromonospora sp. WMMD987]
MSTDDETCPAVRLTVLTGPSGAGRGGVVEAVRVRSSSVWVPVPVTTRARRPGETDGVDRLFREPVEFDRMIAAGELLEWSRAGPYRRGTPRAPLVDRLARGRPVLLPLDLPGALALRAALSWVRLVLLLPPGHLPDPAVAARAAHTVRHDRTERAADELVGLLGSS